MEIDPYIFRAYDIRGIYKKNLDEEVMFKIGYVLGKERKKFAVGNDIRKSGRKLAHSLIKGLNKGGSKAIYAGTTSFGQTLFAGWHLKKDITLYITASHLPPQWNGLKIYYGSGVAVPEKKIMEIRDKVLKLEIDNERSKAKVKKIAIKKKYSDYLLREFSKIKNNNLKVVLDCGNGAMCLSAPEVFRRLGFKVIKLYCDADPTYPGRGAKPTPKATKVLWQKVKKNKADFGIAFDGDGDRVVIIDDKGRYLSGNQIGIILAKNILKKSKRKNIITSVAGSMGCEKELEPLKGKVIRVPVGHTYLTILAKKHNAIFGMEESGHIIMPQYFWFDDALIVPLKISEVILEEKKRLSELVDDITIYPFEEIKLDCPDNVKFKIAKKIKDDFSKKYKNVDTIDGVKVNFPDGWILIRVSNTSPMMRLYVEALSQAKLKELKDKFLKILKKEIKNWK